MVKIIDEINKAEAAGQTYIAFEYFPPRTPEGVANLYKRCATFATQCEQQTSVTKGSAALLLDGYGDIQD